MMATTRSVVWFGPKLGPKTPAAMCPVCPPGAVFMLWYEPARYETLVGEELTYDEFCNGDLFSVDTMRDVAKLSVGEELRGVEIEPPRFRPEARRFVVRRVS